MTTLVTTLAIVLLGLLAGLFTTYSISVPRALARVDDGTYVRTFQAINATIGTPVFAAIFIGGPLVTLAAGVLHEGRAAWLLGAALLVVLVGVHGVTFAGNLPLNLALARRTTPQEWPAARAAFERPWNRLNLVRAGASTAGLALAALALALS